MPCVLSYRKMKTALFLVLVGFSFSMGLSRNKRAAYDLPAGAEIIVGPIRKSFVCSKDGYYADQENNCQIFHVCQSVTNAGGTSKMQQWSFFCGNLTIFNQLTLTCTYPEDAVPCERAHEHFDENKETGTVAPYDKYSTPSSKFPGQGTIEIIYEPYTTVSPRRKTPATQGPIMTYPPKWIEIYTQKPIVTPPKWIKTQGPHVTQGPYVTQDPYVTQGPYVTQRPHVTQGPYITRGPYVTHGPHVTQGPYVTKGPHVTRGPYVTQGPHVTYRPVVTYTTKGIKTVTQRPIVTTPKWMKTQGPYVTQRPYVTREPYVSQGPYVTQGPHVTQKPYVTYTQKETKTVTTGQKTLQKEELSGRPPTYPGWPPFMVPETQNKFYETK